MLQDLEVNLGRARIALGKCVHRVGDIGPGDDGAEVVQTSGLLQVYLREFSLFIAQSLVSVVILEPVLQ